MDWAIATARARGAAALLLTVCERQSPRACASTSATASSISATMRSRSATRSTTTSSCGWRCDASRSIRAPRARRRRRTAFSAGAAASRPGVMRGPQRRHRLGRRSRGGRREPPPRRRRGAARRARSSRSTRSIRADAVAVIEPFDDAAPARRRAGHRPPGPRARHPHRRLRAGAVRRPRGRRGRRGACRVEGRARRRHRCDDRRDGNARRATATASPPRSARASRAPATRSTTASSRRFAEADPANERFFADGTRRPPPVRPRSLCRPPPRRRRASRRVEALGARHLCRRPTASTASAAPRTAANPTMAARSAMIGIDR